MCCCGTPNINGQPGYRWQPNDPPRIRPVDPPQLEEEDKLIYDEPGRCGCRTDSHSHHYRLVKRSGWIELLVQHGGGFERIKTNLDELKIALFASLDSDARYWMLSAIYDAHYDGAKDARDKTNASWRKAAAEKRIKTRKVKAGVKVWIEDPVTTTDTLTNAR